MQSGTYFLGEDRGPQAARIEVMRGVAPACAGALGEAVECMTDERRVPRTPNPMNPRTFVKRRQASFLGDDGTDHGFSGQKFACIRSEVGWPALVARCLGEAKRIVGPELAGLYNGVHANYYPDGSAGVAPHADDESCLVRGMPIVSFTYNTGSEPRPRIFSIYKKPTVEQKRKKQKLEKVLDVELGSGDVLVMRGRMQEQFLHAVEAAKPPKQFANAGRLNLTVRAFATPEAPAPAVGEKRERE